MKRYVHHIFTSNSGLFSIFDSSFSKRSWNHHHIYSQWIKPCTHHAPVDITLEYHVVSHHSHCALPLPTGEAGRHRMRLLPLLPVKSPGGVQHSTLFQLCCRSNEGQPGCGSPFHQAMVIAILEYVDFWRYNDIIIILYIYIFSQMS